MSQKVSNFRREASFQQNYSANCELDWAVTGECPLIGPLQLAIHVVRNRRAGEQSHTGTRQTKEITM